jgi:hypothetical protein
MIAPILPDDLVTVEIEVLENGDRALTINDEGDKIKKYDRDQKHT